MGIFDSIGKVFKKVTNSTVGKVVGGALGIGALVFTGGAALGLGGIFAGGFGGAVTGLTGALGLTGAAGSIITGAITQAGYGALLGGALGAVTGGDPLEAAAGGALVGAATGGVSGGLGLPTDPLGGVFDSAPAAPSPTGLSPGDAAQQLTSNASLTSTTKGFAPATSPAPPARPDLPGLVQGGSAASAPAPTTTSPVAAGLSPTTTAPTQTGVQNFLQRNANLAGPALMGLGQGLLGGSDQTEYMRERDRSIQQSYELPDPEPFTPKTNTYRTGAEKYARPWERKSEAARRPGSRYRFDPEQRRVVRDDG